jgi:hypothetical protein
MEREFRAGLLSSVVAAGLIVALTVLAFMDRQPAANSEPYTVEFFARG